MLFSFLIFGISEAYRILITVLESSYRAELTFDEAVAALLEESHHKTLDEDTVVLLTRTTKLPI